MPTAAATPIANDPIVVERITKIKTLRLAMTGRDLAANFNAVVLDSVDVGYVCVHGIATSSVDIVGGVLRNTSGIDARLGALQLSSSRFCPAPGQSLALSPVCDLMSFTGGMIDGDGVGATIQLSQARSGTFARLMTQDADLVLISPPGNDREGWSLGQLGLFDSNAPLSLESPGALLFGSTTSTGPVLWGSGGTGYSVELRAGASWLYRSLLALGTNLNISSSGGDILFVTDTNRTQCRAFDDTTGLYTGLRTLSFANLVALIADGGFSVNAGIPHVFDPVSGCSIQPSHHIP